MTFIDLPAEFSPPEKAVAAIVALTTRAEREAYWLRIPEKWRSFIGKLTTVALGLHISELPELEDRRRALDQVPGIWLDEVRWHTRRLYNTRDLRAEYARECAEERERAIRGGKW